MLRNFFRNTNKTLSSHSNVNKRHYDAAFRYRKKISATAQSDAQQANVRTDHPVIVDKAEPNVDGSFPVKAQATHGSGSPSNPSKQLDPQKDLSGKNQPQRIVIPTKPLNVSPTDLQPTPIPNSDAYLYQKHIKDNLHKAGAKPSNYKSGDPYQP